jgi:DNA (cytosine-5)-methyltransferase 1
VPNFGDMTKFKEWPDANIDVLAGGTPCQSFSIAGLRKGLDDPRGNLMLTYLAIADRYKPKYILWENVPGVLSSNGGRDFGTFLGGLGKLGYGFAYRVLDAQFCRTHEHPRAVPQRRRRVFVIGCLGDWRSAAGILFDSESLRGNPPPSRNKGQEVAGTIGAGAANGGPGHGARSGDSKDELIVATYADVSLCLSKGSGQRYDYETETFALAGNTIGRAPKNGGNHTGYDDTGSSYTLTKTDVHAVAYGIEGAGHCLRSGASKADKPCSTTYVQQQMRVRRLTPLECERLQGFPDFWTDIPGASNTARYKALGNSMAVNSMRILGERIAMAESIL